MRIIGYIEHPVLMITVFKMDDKFSVKFENNLLEQTYKYRGGPHLSNLEDVKRLIDEPFMRKVEEMFRQMETTRVDSLKVEDSEDEFEEII